MAVLGTVLSLVVSAQHAGKESFGARDDEGAVIAEIAVAEILGPFRNVVRLVFLLVSVERSSEN
jgi:hypothetical protein